MVTYFSYYESAGVFILRQKCEFLAACKAAGINGGRKVSTWEVLQREASNGNQKAAQLLKVWRRVEQ